MSLRPAKIKKPRKKVCPFCRESYQPDPGLQVNCCHKLECRASYIGQHVKKARAKRAAEAKKKEAEERRQFRERKEKTKTAKQLRPVAWRAFSAYVLFRDDGKTCISCPTVLVRRGAVGGDYDAGHYRSKGSAKHLEFDERNVHGQCKHCNDKLKGNPTGYRKGLIERFGIDVVEAIEADQEGRSLRADDYRAIAAYYREKLKELKRERNQWDGKEKPSLNSGSSPSPLPACLSAGLPAIAKGPTGERNAAANANPCHSDGLAGVSPVCA